MPASLKKGDRGNDVRTLQELLSKHGFPVDTDGDFGPRTLRAVRAFQSQNLDQHGQPLTVDGKVGPLTWWSLTHPKPLTVAPSAVNYARLPAASMGGSKPGRAALKAAIAELKAGAGEIGGNNRGPWVKKYLEGAGLDEGNSWCASFVSWCYREAAGGKKDKMPFVYCPGARALLRQFKEKGWAHEPQSGYEPKPGDLVVWWRVSFQGWQGHIGLVHSIKDGMLYTIEGNRSPQVQGFSYVLDRIDRLLGFGHVPD